MNKQANKCPSKGDYVDSERMLEKGYYAIDNSEWFVSYQAMQL